MDRTGPGSKPGPFLVRLSLSNLARITHQLPTAAADLVALVAKPKNERVDEVSA